MTTLSETIAHWEIEMGPRTSKSHWGPLMHARSAGKMNLVYCKRHEDASGLALIIPFILYLTDAAGS